MSLPVITLADAIPPRALMAWDRRLLSRFQNLTLLISNLRGIYPPIGGDGTYTSAAQRAGTAVTFKVGLTLKYKPGKEFAQEAGRTFGLITHDAEDELRIKSEKAAALEFDFDYESEHFGEAVPPVQAPVEEEEEEDEGRFDKFSLSSSLESLLDHAFLKVVQLRRKFGLGWAGAELLFSEVEKTQMKAENIYQEMHHVSHLFPFSSISHRHAYRYSLRQIRRKWPYQERMCCHKILSWV
jgi:ubiquitin-conjugating enzyme E2 Q